jgi:hypothetical protein
VSFLSSIDWPIADYTANPRDLDGKVADVGSILDMLSSDIVYNPPLYKFDFQAGSLLENIRLLISNYNRLF